MFQGINLILLIILIILGLFTLNIINKDKR